MTFCTKTLYMYGLPTVWSLEMRTINEMVFIHLLLLLLLLLLF